MSDTNLVIALLGRDLRPVRRLGRPVWRMLAWLALAVLLGGFMAARVNLPAMLHRVSATPDLWLAIVGSVLTAIGAVIATFLVSLPDRSPRWAWLAAPGLLLWLAASGAGCLRAGVPGLPRISLLQSGDACLPFILAISVPLAAALLLLLRPVKTIRPELTTATGGLAVGATAASLLWLVHPFDAGLSDLLVHSLAVLLVVLATRLLGGRLLAQGSRPRNR